MGLWSLQVLCKMLGQVWRWCRRLAHALFTPPPPVRPPSQNLVARPPKPRIPPSTREAVWLLYQGNKEQGPCYCCQAKISRHGGWHCSHVVASAKGGDESVDNLRPCCPHCNLSMGDQNLYVYIQEHQLHGRGAKDMHKYLHQHPSQRFDRRTNNWKGRT